MDPRLYKFDLQKSPDDPRDFLLETIYPETVKLPDVWDLRKQMRPIRDQGNEGTCSAQTSAAMKEWQEFADVGFKEHMSPWFIYQLRSNQGQAGMTPRDTMEILYKIGIVSEKDYPYLTKMPITPELKEKAGNYKIQGYALVNTIDSLRKALFANGPCYIAFPVYNPSKKEFWKPEYTGQANIGGHAVCFTGDTKVSLLDGRELSFIELEKEFKNKEFWVYSCDELGNAVPGKAHSPRITQKNAKIIKILLDNGEEIKCTENHKFLLKTGNYKKAKDLTVDDSLMPLYRRLTTSRMAGYEQYLNNYTNKWEYTHIMVAYHNKNEIKTNKTVVHHKNFNKRDNSLNNLQIMDKQEHWNLHAGLAYGLNNWVKTIEGRKFLNNNAKKMWKENKEFKEKTSEILRNQGNITQQKLKNEGRNNPWVEWAEKNPNDAFKMRSLNGKKNIKYANTKKAKAKSGKTYKEHIKNDPEFKAKVINRSTKNLQNYNDKIKSGELKTPEYYNKKRLTALKVAFRDYKYKKYDSFEEYIQKDKNLKLNNDGFLVPYNHKIKKIEFYGYEDVYDITVEKYHNFALTAGVFVHNCVAGYLKDSFIIRNSWSSQWGDGGYSYYPFKDFGMHWEIWTCIDSSSNMDTLNLKKSKECFLYKLLNKKL